MSRTGKSSFYNSSGYADPTAFEALKPIIQEEQEMEEQVSDLVFAIKMICDLAGFEVMGRIKFKHKKTGKEFK